LKIGETVNEYGTPVSQHFCEDCQTEFTVCPPAGDDWGGCLSEECDSYDIHRDIDLVWGRDDVKIVKEAIH